MCTILCVCGMTFRCNTTYLISQSEKQYMVENIEEILINDEIKRLVSYAGWR